MPPRVAAVAMTMAAAVFGDQLAQIVDESTDRRTPVGLASEVDNGVARRSRSGAARRST